MVSDEDRATTKCVEGEYALLTGQHIDRSKTHTPPHKWREIGLFAWAMIATVAVVILAVVYQHESSIKHNQNKWGPAGKPSGKRNLIFMVSDGMGPTSLSL